MHTIMTILKRGYEKYVQFNFLRKIKNIKRLIHPIRQTALSQCSFVNVNFQIHDLHVLSRKQFTLKQIFNIKSNRKWSLEITLYSDCFCQATTRMEIFTYFRVWSYQYHLLFCLTYFLNDHYPCLLSIWRTSGTLIIEKQEIKMNLLQLSNLSNGFILLFLHSMYWIHHIKY